MAVTQFSLYKNVDLYKYAHNSGTKGSPDMILSAFDVKCHEKKKEIHLRARRPPTKNNKNHEQNKIATQNGSPRTPARPPVRGVQGAAAPWEEEKVGQIIPSPVWKGFEPEL